MLSLRRLFRPRTSHAHLPVDLVIVRNGVSQGMMALSKKESENSSSAYLLASLKEKPASQWRLTPFGRREAHAVGDWIRSTFKSPFDAYLTGEYIRSMETAACLRLPNAQWIPGLYLRPRDFGKLSELGRAFDRREIEETMLGRARDAFYWSPPNGESIAHLTLRTERIIYWIRHHVKPEGSVIIVTHKDVMETLRIRIENISQMEYGKIADPPANMILNRCSVLQYTRRNPATGEIVPRYQWMRVSTPWMGEKGLPTEWNEICSKASGNEELMNEVRTVQRVF